MTLPELPDAVPDAVTPPTNGTDVVFPLSWILTNASSAVQYRAIRDVAKLPDQNDGFAILSYSFRPAIHLAMAQGVDGTWGGAMLATPTGKSSYEGVGTITAVRRLLEYGWDRESPPMVHSRRVLFRLLAEDNDPAFVYELGGKGRQDIEVTQRGRRILREAAAAALAQMGYESDPRLRGAARRMLDRVVAYLTSPLAEKPWIRVGNRQVLAAEASPPSIYMLQMLAYMPLFRHENYSDLSRIYEHLCQALPRQESVQAVGTHLLEQDHLVLGDMLPHRNAADADIPFALHWLELMARLNFLKRNEQWSRLFERFLDDRDRDFVWHPRKGAAAPRSGASYVWHTYPLEDVAPGGEIRWGDVTFRLGLIARLSGRPVILA